MEVPESLVELHYRNELAKVLGIARDPLPPLPYLLALVEWLRSPSDPRPEPPPLA